MKLICSFLCRIGGTFRDDIDSIVVEELYGSLTEESINETMRTACLEEEEYQTIKGAVAKLFS